MVGDGAGTEGEFRGGGKGRLCRLEKDHVMMMGAVLLYLSHSRPLATLIISLVCVLLCMQLLCRLIKSFHI
jgi:hypothetical protein